MCGTETLCSHTRCYGWSSRIRKARGPTPQKGTESSHCWQRGTKLTPYVNEWWVTDAQAKTKRNLRSPESKKHASERPAGLQLVGFTPNSQCRDTEPGLNAGYACRLTCQWLQKILKFKKRQPSWVGKIPRRRKWQSTPVFMRGKSHGQRSLAGYSPWGRKSRTRLATKPPPPSPKTKMVNAETTALGVSR